MYYFDCLFGLTKRQKEAASAFWKIETHFCHRKNWIAAECRHGIVPQRPLWTYTPWIHNIYTENMKMRGIYMDLHPFLLFDDGKTDKSKYLCTIILFWTLYSKCEVFFFKPTVSHLYHNLFQLSYHFNICHHSALSDLPNFPLCIFWIAGYHQFMQLSTQLAF